MPEYEYDLGLKLIASIIYNPSEVGAVDWVESDMFPNPHQGILWTAIKKVASNGYTDMMIDVLDELKPSTDIVRNVFNSAVSKVGPVAQGSAGYYADRLALEHKRRMLLRAAHQAVDLVERGETEGLESLLRDHWDNALNGAKPYREEVLGLHHIHDFLGIEHESQYNWVVPGLLEHQERMILVAPVKTGKGLAHGETVLTPDGWVKIEDICEGDSVIGSNGMPTQVRGVFPQGIKPLYRVTTDDGRTVVVDDSHLWTLNFYDRNPRTVSTLELKELIENDKRLGMLPIATIQHPTTDLPVDPYVLGLLLGDGSFRRNTITFCKPDEELAQTVSAALGSDVVSTNGKEWRIKDGGVLKKALQELGLYGLLSPDKFIPDMYLIASVEQRLALLRGLMDTDGGMEGNSAKFTTSSPYLADGFMDLVRSLGGTATRTLKTEPKYQHNGEVRIGKSAHRFSVRLPQGNPFRHHVKASRWENGRKKRKPTVRVVSVERVQDGESTCISVAAEDGLFVAKDYIVTHNSVLTRQFALCVASGRHPFDPHYLIPKQRVLTIDLENPAGILRRDLKRQIQGLPEVENMWVLHRPEGMDLSSAKDRRVLEQAIIDCRPDLVVIGPLYKLYDALDDSWEKQAAGVQKPLDQWRSMYGCAFLLEHHASKADPTGLFGSSRWARWFDLKVALVPEDPALPPPFRTLEWQSTYRDSRRISPEYIEIGEVLKDGDVSWIAKFLEREGFSIQMEAACST